jgi:hypothetical protein
MTQDDLKIPKLDTTGKNWPTWKTKLEHTLGVKWLKRHLYGTALSSTDPVSKHSPAWTPATAAEEQEVEDYEKALEDWDVKDCAVKHYISSFIPDTLYIHLNLKTTGAEYLKVLHELFEDRLCHFRLPLSGSHWVHLLLPKDEANGFKYYGSSQGEKMVSHIIWNAIFRSNYDIPEIALSGRVALCGYTFCTLFVHF